MVEDERARERPALTLVKRIGNPQSTTDR